MDWPDISLPPINLYTVPKMNPNPNNCAACSHIMQPQGGWCYMFRDEPTGPCAKHTLNVEPASTWSFPNINVPSLNSYVADLRSALPGPDAATKLVNLGLDCYQGIQEAVVRTTQSTVSTVSDAANTISEAASSSMSAVGDAASSAVDMASSGLSVASDAASSGMDAVLLVGSGIVDVASGAVDVVGYVVEVAGSIAGGIADSF